ncbi:hypothetical protein [Nostoc sp. CHAB 5715]|uniref:hypothetical protein n=1 Tax=Nostoc sp. CHAB 5715 TaxID=2780400 RepID=UPI001E470A43|nr:hypothetical protein [Nostoc sp. CHAB 5715]MCC5624033.1 hypothetical protein [Nostoc sp. CHAB 5715]
MVRAIRISDPLGAIGAYWSTPHRATSEEIELLEIFDRHYSSCDRQRSTLPETDESKRP